MRRQELVRSHDILVHTKGGRELWVNVSTIRVPSRRKDLTVLVHLFRDASRQKEIERFVNHLLAGVEKLSSFREADPATASSDSRTAQSLTNREREVLRLLFSGSSTATVAHKLGISPATARNHITKILGKLDVHSRLEAVTLALRNGVI
jgi:DNA-binding NarL/FixJ family response regulator